MVQINTNLNYEILLLLMKGELHVRGIAKMLGESHTTVIRRLRDLAKLNVVDYRSEGKNKVFFIKKNMVARAYVYIAEHYKLIKLLQRYPELSVIFDDLLKKGMENMVILFGSYAKFQAKPDSDIDIYVETANRSIKKKIEEIHSKINAKIGGFELENSLIKEIMKNHIILKGIERYYEKSKFFG